MSQENVEIVRAAFEAFNRGDIGASHEFWDPEIEWHHRSMVPEAGVYRGQGGAYGLVEWLPRLGACAWR